MTHKNIDKLPDDMYIPLHVGKKGKEELPLGLHNSSFVLPHCPPVLKTFQHLKQIKVEVLV